MQTKTDREIDWRDQTLLYTKPVLEHDMDLPFLHDKGVGRSLSSLIKSGPTVQNNANSQSRRRLKAIVIFKDSLKAGKSSSRTGRPCPTRDRRNFA